MSQYRRQKRRRNRSGLGTIIYLVGGGFIFLVCGSLFAAAGLFASVSADMPRLQDLKPLAIANTSSVYASDGTRLGFIQGDVLRSPTSNIPQSMRDATVAIEDKRFYKHNGVDPGGVARAAMKNLSSGDSRQGGSTLTMQLIRNTYPSGNEKTLKRKIREAKLAIELEQKHPSLAGKRWILGEYLNNVPYGTVGGQTALGVEAAAHVFFNKPASRLKIKEAALLAGLPQAPSEYNPFLSKKLARTRRNQVLSAMAEQGYITHKHARNLSHQGLGVRHNAYYAQRKERYFFDFVYQELVQRYGFERVQTGGMKVYTTLNLSLQQAARRAMKANLQGPSSALVSMDPHNGKIKAMASSTDYSNSTFNLAAQGKRQPGSVFKIMVMMAALRKGIDINQVTYDSHPLDFFDQKTQSQIKVQTDDGNYSGQTTIFEALVKSDNTVFQQLDLDVGPNNVRRAAYDLGITSHLDAFPAEGLGGLTYGVSPLEVNRSYATINNGGVRIKPTAISKVVFADGSVDNILKNHSEVPVFTDGQAHEAIKAMEANVERGTGTAAQLGCPTAGKTGTTSNFTDAWFSGFTTSLNTTVWVGYPDAGISMPGMFGGTAPAQIFHDFMVTAMQNKPCKPFPSPQKPFVAKDWQGQFAN